MRQRIKNIYHLGIAILANVFYGFPSRKLKIIGVTGTDGKTTTTSLIYHILNTAGLKASMITSVGAIIDGKEYGVGFHVTTPSSFALQRFFKKAAHSVQGPVGLYLRPTSSVASVPAGARRGSPAPATLSHNFLVLETTSHALDQHRIFGINFEVGVLTNVTHEHLDYHKTYENYAETKAKLLRMSKVAVVNRDDHSFGLISKLIPIQSGQNSKLLASRRSGQLKTQKFITYGIKDAADITPENFKFRTNLIGEFNKYNVLAAVAVCRELGINDETIRKGTESFVPPLGREDIVYKNDFTVMIDFAHTPNAIDQILSSVREDTKGRIIHVFGSAGLRDRTKRPLMGKFSSKYSDLIILTAEDPRTEVIEDINNDIESGINSSFKLVTINKYQNSQRKKYLRIDDRIEAITFAISMAKKYDLVIITGKSHEKSMNYGHGEVPWDEYKVVKNALKKKHKI